MTLNFEDSFATHTVLRSTLAGGFHRFVLGVLYLMIAHEDLTRPQAWVSLAPAEMGTMGSKKLSTATEWFTYNWAQYDERNLLKVFYARAGRMMVLCTYPSSDVHGVLHG